MKTKLIAPILVMVILLAALLLMPTGAPAVEAPDYDSEIEDGRVEYGGVTYMPRSYLESILFLGLDREQEDGDESYNNPAQADFLALLIVDHREQSYSILHLNRDTMCQIPVLDLQGIRTGSRRAQLAIAHAYGTGGKDSCLNAAKAVSNLLYDAPVTGYLSLPVQSIGLLNDSIGGVEVMVEDDFSAIDPSLVQGQRVRLMGSQVETFVRSRSRMADSSNLARMKRQRVYLDGLIQQMTAQDMSQERIQSLLGPINAELVTDLSVEHMAKLAQCIREYRYDGLYVTEGTARVGEKYMEFWTDESQLRSLVLELFYRPLERTNETG